MNQLPENSLCIYDITLVIYDITLVTSYLIGLFQRKQANL